MVTLVPLREDRAKALEFGRGGLRARGEPAEPGSTYARFLDERIDSPSGGGRLIRDAGGAVGAAWWERSNVTGVAVDLVYLERPHATSEGYGAVLDRVAELAGPIDFVYGPLAHLDPEAEAALFTRRGYARFGRSEMVWDRSSLERLGSADGPGLRPVGTLDTPGLARLHAAAYRGRFDQFLFREEADDERDAERHMREIVAGRWGRFLADDSRVLEVAGALRSAVLCVERPDGVLIVDVMADPAHRGEGHGRAALAGALRALARRASGRLYLNVTEGNRRAIRLYEGLGFVRSLGPTRDWYHRARVPADPERD